MRVNINTTTYSTKERILAFFMAFLIFTMTCPELFEGWGIGLIVHAAAANGEIHSTNTDKTSIYLFNGENPTYNIQDNADTAAGGTSPYTYSGKYTNNNKVTVFDYVSDYELEARHGYNNCYQYEDGYVDTFKAFNRAVSSDYDISNPTASDLFEIRVKNNSLISSPMLYFFAGDDNQEATTWANSPHMTYDSDSDEYYYVNKKSNLKNPTKMIIRLTSSVQSENLTCPDTGTSTLYEFSDSLVFRVKDEGNNLDGKNMYLYAYKDGGDIKNAAWPGEIMTYDPDTGYWVYTWTRSWLPVNIILNNKYTGGGNWQTTELSETSGSFNNRTYYIRTRSDNQSKVYWDHKDKYYPDDVDSETLYNTKYTNPLYFGCFYYSNNASSYGGSSSPNPKDSYENFYWQANMGLKNTTDNIDEGNIGSYKYRGSAVVQGLVGDTLYEGSLNGTLTDSNDSSIKLPYFDEQWAEENPTLMKYYNNDDGKDITFPFYEVTKATTGGNVIVKDGDDLTGGSLGTGEKARFYQFKSSDATLKFSDFNSVTHTGYFKESNTDIVRGYWYETNDPDPNDPSKKKWSTKAEADDTRSNVGFYPFNTNNDGDLENANKHNLGLGTKFEMSFQLEPDGCVKAVTTDVNGQNVRDADSDTRIHTIFEFEGDDDLWVFIDGKLVLDMGGDHNKSHGVIDFATKTVTIDKAITLGDGSSKDDLAATPVRTPTSTPTNSVEDLTTKLSPSSFKGSEYTNDTHTMTIFYMERGMKDSNLLVRFNYSPISNSSKMKVAEVTKFDGVNAGLLSLTQSVAEDDIFQYVVSNKGTVKDDAIENTAEYPFTTSSVRNSNGKATTLTPNGTGTSASIPYCPPGHQNGANWANDTTTESRVSGTSYLWVDKAASVPKMVGKTSGTNDRSNYNAGGELYLMYGTNDDLYNSSSTGYESSAEFESQFSRDSTMKIIQNNQLYTVTRGDGPTPLFNGTTGAFNGSASSTRTVSTYYDTNYRIVDRGGNTVDRNTDGTFTFNNRTTAGVGVKSPVNEYLAVQLTEYVENTVKTRDLSVTKKVTGLTTNPKSTEYKFKLTLTKVFGGTVDVSDYSHIVVSKSGEVGTSTPISQTGEFTLKKGQKMTIKGIPYGTQYKIEEINTDSLHQAPNAETNPITGQITTATTIGNDNVAVEVSNNYKNSVDVTVKKTTGQQTPDLSDAELELWYKESDTLQTYSRNNPQIVPNQKNSMQVSKSSGEIGVPGLQKSESTYTYYTTTTSYEEPPVPSSEDEDWILPRSDSDYIYFRDYNVGQYAGYNDKESFNNTTGKRSWRKTTFATQHVAESNNPYTHNQTQELGFNDNYWYAAEFYGPNKKTVKYAMWERFVDKFTYTPYGESSSTTVDTVVWKIQPPDGYNQVRFILLDGDNWIRSTEKFTFNLGEIYHKTSWGGVYSNDNYYDVPVNKETENTDDNLNRKLWAHPANDTPDNRNTAMDQPRKYEPTTQKVIFYCNSTQVWHNIHIEFFKQNNTSGAITEDDNKYDRVNGQAFPGYMMEPYAYAESNYRLRANGIEQYLTYELTIPKGATHFRINNGVSSGNYNYRTKITQLANEPGVKNGGNYWVLNETATATTSCTSGTPVTLTRNVNTITGLSNEKTDKTYSESNITSDCDYVYFDATSAGWNKVYAYFYGGGNLRDDNWQRACYSAWPGVAPVGTDYWENDGSTTTTVHSNTYSIQTNGNTYNGKDTKIVNDVTVNDKGTLSPEASFKLSNDRVIYKFRVPKGDDKNYRKVVFNNGLKSQSGGSETGVIDYQAGYIYDKGGTSTQYYKHSPTKDYSGRQITITLNAGEENGTTQTLPVEYVYVKNTQNWDNLHITFYDTNGNQILQKDCGYVMDYAGTLTENETTYKYYRMPIPEKAASFSVNNGKNTTATPKCDIIRYAVDDTDAAPKSDSQATANDRFVYELSNNTLTRLGYSSEPADEPTVVKTEKGQEESTATYQGYAAATPDACVRKTNGTVDTINIRDVSGWNVPIGFANVTFYNEGGAVVGSGIMMKTNADADGKVWYTKKIPTNAKSFSVSYTKVVNNAAAITTTPKYPIYSSSEDSNGNKTASGDMFYETVGANKLSIIHTEPTSYVADDETYDKRGDDLYLKCLKSEKTTYWKDMTVTFYANGDNVIREGVTAKFINDDGTNSWYKVSIPTGAESFTVTGGTTSHTTDRADIYELRTKSSRYRKNYTLGDMQYELPSDDETTTPALLYPIFTPDDEYTLELGNGQTISSLGSLIPVDVTQVETYANQSAPTRPKTTASATVPVLYNTDSTDITYSWTEEGTGDGMLRFDNSELGWSTVRATFYGSDDVEITHTDMDNDGSSDLKKVTVPSGAVKVDFSKNGSTTDGEHTGKLTLPGTSPNAGKNQKYTPNYETAVGDIFVLGMPNNSPNSNDWDGYIYFYNSGGNAGDAWPGKRLSNGGYSGYNTNSPGQKGWKITIPSNSYGKADHIILIYWASAGKGNYHFYRTSDYALSDLEVGKGIYGGNSHGVDSNDFDDTYDKVPDSIKGGENTKTSFHKYDIPNNFGTVQYKSGGSWTATAGSSATTNYTYQPEDRYGMLSEQNTNADSTLGVNDVNDFIYVTVPDSIDTPYIQFFKVGDVLSVDSGKGILLNASDMKLNDMAYSMVASKDAVNHTTTYRVRLPKNAWSFAISDGTDTGTHYALYTTSATPLTVQASDGQLPPNNYEGDTVDLTDFHHAGSTFSVNGTAGANYLKISLTDVRDGYTTVKSDMDDPLNPKTDDDYVFLTLPASEFSGWSAPCAYYYGAEDGEYSFTQSSSTITFPGIRDSGHYTDKAGRTVYRFQLPKTINGKYDYVMFSNGTAGSISEGKAIVSGQNYILDTSHTLDYGTSINAYKLTAEEKAPYTTTANYSSGSYIYIINNGTQDLTSEGTDTTVGQTRTNLDEIHVVFFSDADGENVVGSGSIDAYQDAGYIPDKVGTKDDKDVYRIQVPSGAKYFQINNGFGKGTTGSNYSLRKSEIKALTLNGLYKFVQGETDAAKYIEGTDYPTNAQSRQNPRYLLTLVNEVPEGDEEQFTGGTVDIKLATIVTGPDGKQKYIKWLRMNEDGTQVDTNYLDHTTTDIGATAPNGTGTGLTTVKVKKDGEYYWKEVVAPSGYKVNENVTDFSTEGYSATNPPTVSDDPNTKGSLTLNKKLFTAKSSGTNDGENQKFTFVITLTAPVGTKWETLNTASPLTFFTQTGSDESVPVGASTTPVSSSDIQDGDYDNEKLTHMIRVTVPATGLTKFIIGNIPSGTTYYVTEEAPVCTLSVDNSEGTSALSATVKLTAPEGKDWSNYELTYSPNVTHSEGTQSGQGLTITVNVPASTKLDIGNIPDGTAYTVIAGGNTKTGTLSSGYSSTPVKITENMYKTVNDTVTLVKNENAEEMAGTIPSYDTSTQNAVYYEATNKHLVGSLTLGNTDTGAMGPSPQAAINLKDGDGKVQDYTHFKYEVYLTNTDVDLRDYISYSTLTSPAYDATVKQVGQTALRSDVTAEQYAANPVHSIKYEVDLLANNGRKTLGNLPIGTKYTIIEQAADATRNQATCVTDVEIPTKYNEANPVTVTGSSTKPVVDNITETDLHPTVVIHNDYSYTSPENPTEVIFTKTAKEKVGTTDIGDVLAGAKFQLFNADDTSSEIKFTLTTPNSTDVTGKKTNVYTVSTSGTYNVSSTLTWLETGEDGRLHIKGLPNGNYYLEEQEAPAGFSNKDSNSVDNGVAQNKKVYFSVGKNTPVKEISASDEMEPAYIKLYEHINEKRDEWGDPTFIFKIKQTGYYDYSGDTPTITATNGKEILVALTVNDDGTLTNDTILGSTYNGWYQESTDEQTTVNSQAVLEYQGMYDIDSQGRIRVEPGTYSISRVPVSRYEFVADTWKLESDNNVNTYASHETTEANKMTGTESAMTNVTIPKTETALVHYYDKVSYYDKFSQVDEKINKFYTLGSTTKANKTLKGIRVEDYHQTGSGNPSESFSPDTTSSSLVASIPSRFKAYFIYADGSEIPMDAANKKKLTISYDPNDNKIDGTGTEFADFSYTAATENDDNKITVANAASYTSKVYTLKASYTDGGKTFNTKFDLVFKADQS